MAFTPSDAAPQSGRDLQSFQPDSGISPFDKLDRPDASLRPGTSSQSSDLGGPPVFARVDDNRLSFSLPPLSFSGDNTREIDQAGPPPSIESSLRQDASALPSIDKSFESLLPARPHSQSFGANGEVPEVNLANAIKAVSQGNCTMAAELTRVEPSGNPMDQIDRNRSPIASLLGNLRSGGSEERNFDSWESYLNLRNDLDALTSDSGNDLTKKAIGLVYAEGDPTYNSAEVARLIPKAPGAQEKGNSSFDLPEMTGLPEAHLNTIKVDLAARFDADKCTYQRTMNPDGSTEDVWTRDDYWTLSTKYSPEAVTSSVRDNFKREQISLSEQFGPFGEHSWQLSENGYKSDRSFYASARRETSFDGKASQVSSYSISDMGKKERID